MKVNSGLPVFLLLVLATPGWTAAETKLFPESATPRNLSEWRNSPDGKVAVCFTVDKTTFGTKEAITVRCAVKNTSDQPFTILRPFGDSFYALASGLAILGPEGAVPYRGAMKDYVLGISSFLELPAHSIADETMEIPTTLFPGLGKPGLYSIGYQYQSSGYPKQPAPENLWQGVIKTAPLTILVH